MNPYESALGRLLNSGPLPQMGLLRTQRLLECLGNPERKYPVFHVAGTNGKGSTCAFLESILRQAGYRVGLYTSPHLTSARERIQINRELMSELDFVALEAAVGSEGTFFERMTAMAFLHFANQQVDVAVIEVGLGGRLDATNVVNPVACGISKIDLDHQEFLGNTLEEIAAEKAGIKKPGVPLVWSEPSGEGLQLKLGLRGPHQKDNALLAINMIKASKWPVSDEAIQKGLLETRWPCRYELIADNLLLDGAHNPGGTRALIRALQEDNLEPEILAIGLTWGHSGLEMARLWYQAFPGARVLVGQSRSLRAVPALQVAEYFRAVGYRKILDLSESWNDKAGLCVATGSLYWAGQIRAMVCDMPIDAAQMTY